MRKLALGVIGFALFATGVALAIIGASAIGTLLFQKSWRGNPLLPAAGLPIGIVAVLVAIMIDQRQIKSSAGWQAARMILTGCAVTYLCLTLTRTIGFSPVHLYVSAGLFLLATYSWLIGYSPKEESARVPLFAFVGVTQIVIAIQAFSSKNWALCGLATVASMLMLRSIIILRRAKV